MAWSSSLWITFYWLPCFQVPKINQTTVFSGTDLQFIPCFQVPIAVFSGTETAIRRCFGWNLGVGNVENPRRKHNVLFLKNRGINPRTLNAINTSLKKTSRA